MKPNTKPKYPDPWPSFRAKMLAELRDIFAEYCEPPHDLPRVFLATRPKALKLGIYHDVRFHFPGLNKKRLRAWFKAWCGDRAYLERIASGTNRHDLDGEDCGLISEEHRADARLRLKPVSRGDGKYRPKRDKTKRERSPKLAAGV